LIVEPANPKSIAKAAEHIRAGGLVTFPTETFYGLAGDPRWSDGVMRVFALKGRDPGRALPLVAGAREQVSLVAPGWEDLPEAVSLADAFWPGPLSLVLAGTAGLADWVRAPDGSIAVRWSSHPVAAALALAVGFPIVATSANRSGARPCRYVDEALASLGYHQDLFALDGGPSPGGLPSTLVDVRTPECRIVRRGVVEEPEIRRVLAAPRPA
jgi:L-threonylcarbamoyladenylate synthase